MFIYVEVSDIIDVCANFNWVDTPWP